jgi:SAM-dependent methyltransferase
MTASPDPAPSPARSNSNLSPESLLFFERTWQVYHQIVADDLMEHAALFAALRPRLQAFLEEWGSAPLTMADLACGDLTTLAPLLRDLPLAGFTGVDACASVIPLAQERLAGWPVPCRWLEDDMLRWAEGPGERHGLISCLFGLHHLADAEKQLFLEVVADRLEPGGLLLIADAFREPGEPLDHYRQRYGRRIRESWTSLGPSFQDHVVAHVSGSDFPAEHDRFAAMAEQSGWQGEWLWRGSHQAEALLVLRRPASPETPRQQQR